MSNGSDTGSDTPLQSNDGSRPTSQTNSGINKSVAQSPPKDTSGGSDAAAGFNSENSANDGASGGPTSVVSKIIETALGGSESDATLNAAADSNDGLNIGVDGNDRGGLEISANQSQDGLTIDIDGGANVDGGANNGSLVGLAGLGDLGSLAGGTGSLIDIDVDQDDGQKAAILDVADSSDGDAQAAVLGSDIAADSRFDIAGSSGLLDGILDDATLLG